MTVRLEVRSASKRYRNTWALRDCDITIEPGSVTAFVGPNGAGKSTLLNAAAGLISLTAGTIAVDGRPVGLQMDPRVGYLAQDKPLYRRWRVSEILDQARDLNTTFDMPYCRQLVDEAGLSLQAKTSALSGGQRSRLALAVVLARRPGIVLLDEPLADLDPLARQEVSQTLMTLSTDTGTSIVMSSHVLSDVRDSCDWLLLMQAGTVTIHEEMDSVVDRHRILVGPTSANLSWIALEHVVEVRSAERQTTVVVSEPPAELPAGWSSEPVDLDEIVLSRLRTAARQPTLAPTGTDGNL